MVVVVVVVVVMGRMGVGVLMVAMVTEVAVVVMVVGLVEGGGGEMVNDDASTDLDDKPKAPADAPISTHGLPGQGSKSEDGGRCLVVA